MKKVALLALVLVVGCQPRWIRPPVVPDGDRAVVENLQITGADAAQERRILNAVTYLPRSLRESTRKIRVFQDNSHFLAKGGSEQVAAHKCDDANRLICMWAEKIRFRTVWHEYTHVYADNISDYYSDYTAFHFYDEWEKLAGDVYGNQYAEATAEGLLTSYSRKSPMEDVAEWAACCMSYIYLQTDPQRKHILEIFSNPNLKKDKRYRLKLERLYKYGFFHEEDYLKLKPLFQ